MRILLTILILIFLSSCQSEIKAKFVIKNMTDNTIDSINIKSFDHENNSNFIQIKPGDSNIYWLDMTDLPKADGDYLLTFKRNHTYTEMERFGYFTNGYPLEEVTNIRIEKDTVIIEQLFDHY